jgi:hypothetical protein
MNNKIKLTIKYAISQEVFFTFICFLLVAIEYFIVSGTFTFKGAVSCFAVLQVPVIYLIVRYWILLSKDPLLK